MSRAAGGITRRLVRTPSSWVDEFLDFSAAKRGEHRCAVSGSVAFLEAPLVDLDNLDDDANKMMLMFSDDLPPSRSPSDHNSVIDDEDEGTWNESEDAVSACKVEPQRILANRQSAQRSSEEAAVHLGARAKCDNIAGVLDYIYTCCILNGLFAI